MTASSNPESSRVRRPTLSPVQRPKLALRAAAAREAAAQNCAQIDSGRLGVGGDQLSIGGSCQHWTPCGGSLLVLGSAPARRREACVGRRRRRAERAIEEVQKRARLAAEVLVEEAGETAGRARRRTRKSRRGIDRSVRKAEHRLGRFWNRGRFRVRRLRRKAERRIDQVMSKAKQG
jgi:hypothetical protein